MGKKEPSVEDQRKIMARVIKDRKNDNDPDDDRD